MDPITAIGLASNLLQVLQFAIRIPVKKLASLFSFTSLYGPAGIIVYIFGSQDVWQMQMQILGSFDEAEAMIFKKSIQEESSIIAVAATILAQIAITALSLNNLSRMHWAARACFILSLVSSIIAVYYATKQYRMLGRCLHAEQVKTWIRDKASSTDVVGFPSVASVVTVSAPNMLLSFSLNSFLVGLGVYFGLTWTRSLDEEAGGNASRAAFITYLGGLCVCYGIYALSSTVVADQTYASDKELLRKVSDYSAGAEERPTHEETGRGIDGIPTQASANGSGNGNLELQTPQVSSERGSIRYTSSNDYSTRRELLEVFQEAAKLRAATAKLDERIARLLGKLGEDDMV